MTETPAANTPKVSVVSITYNHERYIRDALDGFVAQQTDFPVEVIVADDASTDDTPKIITEYANRHPDLFVPILRSRNVGLHGNLTGALSATRGEYLAFCEGDDYWTDPLKLTKQVRFLDRHPETSVCFHPARVIWEGDTSKETKFPSIYLRGNMSVNTLCLSNFISNTSQMYRRLPDCDNIPAGFAATDWYLHMRHALHGDVAMLPETMSVYRRHAQGMWTDHARNSTKFWTEHGAGHAAMSEAMLDLIAGDEVRESLLAVSANFFLSNIEKLPGPEGRAILLDTIARYPRFAVLAMQHRSLKLIPALRIIKRMLAAYAPTKKGLVDLYPIRRITPQL